MIKWQHLIRSPMRVLLYGKEYALVLCKAKKKPIFSVGAFGYMDDTESYRMEMCG